MIRPTSVIWDFNGTILNDVDLAVRAINEPLRKRNLEKISVAYHRQVFCFPVVEYYQKLGFDLDTESHADVSDEFHEEYLAGVHTCVVNEGIEGLLGVLKTAGIAQFVLSAAEQNLLESWVKMLGVEGYFEAVYGLPDRLAKSKVNRGFELIEKYGLDPATSLLIGDTDHDIEVAQALGCHPVVVLLGHQDRICAEVRDYELFDSHVDLLAALEATISAASQTRLFGR